MIQLFYVLLTQLPLLGSIYQKAFEKPLTKEQEEYLLKQLAQHDKSAKEQLICHNLRLVAHIAKKYENPLDDKEDLISIGTIGLMKAIDTYTDNKQTKLATYAAKCITNEILMHLRSNKKRALDVSLNEQIGKDKDGTDMTINDLVKAPEQDLIEQMMLQDQIKKLYTLLDILDKKEYQIIELRYGIHQKGPLTQKEIAQKLGISRSYVSRIEKRALLKLYREFLKRN